MVCLVDFGSTPKRGGLATLFHSATPAPCPPFRGNFSPHQGALVDTAEGEWWFLHFQDAGVYGRIVHLQPVTWRDGWPLMGRDLDGNGIGEPVATFQKPAVRTKTRAAVPQTSDDFESRTLGLQWQWNANHEENWCSLTERKGWLRLRVRPVPNAELANAPNLLTQKFPAREFKAETRVEFSPARAGEEAGLVIMGRAYAALSVRQAADGPQVVFRDNGSDTVLGKLKAGDALTLRVEVREGGLCSFSCSTGGGIFTSAPKIFQAQPGHWIGARAGLYCIATGSGAGGHADFDRFEMLPLK